MPAVTTVGQLLNSAQDSAAASERCAGNIWKLALADPDGTYEELQTCVNYLITVSQRSPYVERCLRFFGVFTARTPPDNEAAAAVVEELLQHLAGHLSALDKSVRFRSTQLLQQLLSNIPDSFLLENTVVEQLRDSLEERLHDKLPAVRAEACKAISHLPDDEDGQPITAAMLELLDTDKSKDVRIAIVQSLPLDTATLPVLLERTRDVNALVRKALVLRLESLSIRLLSIKQRAEVMQQLMQDRDTAVADAAANLLSHWLTDDCRGDPLQLLQLLDVETYTDAAARLVESLISTNSICGSTTKDDSSCSGVISYVEEAIHNSGGKQGLLVGLQALAEQKDGEQQLLEPHEALMWRCVCEWLRTDAISKGLAAATTGGARATVQAAVAAERHEVLERALPESVDQLMELVMRHANAGPTARFAAAQLLKIASGCVEWADAASRAMALPYLQQLIALDPLADSQHENANVADDRSDSADTAGLQLAGNGGDSMFESAVVQLVLAVQGAGAGFAVAMLDGIAPLAAAAGLLTEPGGPTGVAENDVDAAEPSQILQCLTYVKLLLQHLPCGRPVEDDGAALNFESLWEILLLLALKQDNPAIRASAVECLGLYAIACANSTAVVTSTVQLLGPVLIADSCCATKQAAVKALADLALLLGPAAIDVVLRSPETAAALGCNTEQVHCDAMKQQGSSGDAASAGLSVQLAKGLLELLLHQAEALLADASSPAVKPKRGGRNGAASKAEPSLLSTNTANLLAAVAESLCKLLLHQQSWLKRYKQHTAPAAVENSSNVPLPADSRQQQVLLLRRSLSLLLQLQFHPATEAALALRQCLSVFFDVFTAAAQEFRVQLVGACLPAARQALHIVSKKQPAALLVKYVLQLLQATQGAQPLHVLAGDCANHLQDGYMSAALQMLGEVDWVAPVTVGCGLQPAKFKPYLSAILKVVCELPLVPQNSAFADVQLLAEKLSTTVTDATLKKDVASVQQLLNRLAQEAGLVQQQLQQDAMDQLMEKVKMLSLQLPRLPNAVDAAAADSAGPVLATPGANISAPKASNRTASTATAGRATTVRRRASRKKVACSFEEESADDTDTTGSSDEEGTESEAEDVGAAAAGESQPSEVADTNARAAAGKGTLAGSSGARRRSAARQPLAPTTIMNSVQ